MIWKLTLPFYSLNRAKNAASKVIGYIFFLIGDVCFGLHIIGTLIFVTKVLDITLTKKSFHHMFFVLEIREQHRR